MALMIANAADEANRFREILDLIPGDVPDSQAVASDEALAEVGAMLRGLHFALVPFRLGHIKGQVA